MAKWKQQVSYPFSIITIISIILLLLAGLVPATTNAWAPSRTDGTNESVGGHNTQSHSSVYE